MQWVGQWEGQWVGQGMNSSSTCYPLQSETALRAHISQLEVSFREAEERCQQLREDSREQLNK